MHINYSVGVEIIKQPCLFPKIILHVFEFTLLVKFALIKNAVLVISEFKHNFFIIDKYYLFISQLIIISIYNKGL